MAFTVDVDVASTFEGACTPDQAFTILADVPESASHFPGLDSLYELGKDEYLWEMEKIGLKNHALQAVYACKYKHSRARGWVKWTPLSDEGNALVSGQWTLSPGENGNTIVEFVTRASVEVPLPALLKMVLSPMVRREFETRIAGYHRNLQATFKRIGKRNAGAAKPKPAKRKAAKKKK